MANNRGGLSKREYAAKQAGGTLNYKTGKISVPVKSSSSSSKISSSSSSSSNYSAPQNSGEIFVNGQGFSVAPEKQDAFLAQKGIKQNPLTQQYTYIDTSKMFETPDVKKSGSSSNKSSSSSSNKQSSTPVSNNRSLAQGAFNSALGINTANASDGSPNGAKPGRLYTPTVSKSTGLLGDIFQGATNKMQGIYTDLTHGQGLPDWGISEMLGLTKRESGGLTYNLGDTPVDTIIDGKNVSVQPSLPDSTYFDQTPSPYKDWNSFNQNQGNTPDNRADTRVNRPNPQPVANPFIQSNPFSNPSSDISSQDKKTSQPDFTQIQNNPGTIRQFLGNGSPMSTGAFSNGKGYSGLEGASLGMNTSQDNNGILDELKSLLGNTANAAETPQMPQQSMGLFSNNQPNIFQQLQQASTGYSAKNGGMSSMYGTDQAPVFENRQNNSNIPAPIRTNVGGSTGGVMPRQNVQQPTPVNPAVQQYQDSIKGYGSQAKDTEKAYKRALASMLQGIESQYAQSQTEGQTTLDKAKQEDLLKQSGLFNFANQDPNSEQRMQYDQRMNNDYAGQMANLIAKLNASKNQDILSAKSGNQQQLNSAMSSIQSAKSSAQQNLAQLLYSMQNDSANRAQKSSGGGTQKNASFTQMGVDANNQPVWYDNVNHKYVTDLPQGTQKAISPMDQLLGALQGNQTNQGGQGGSWEIDPTTGQKVWVTD